MGKEPCDDPVSLAGGGKYVCREISGVECVRDHLTANGTTLKGMAFAEQPVEVKLLKDFLDQQPQVRMESTSEEWANHFGRFCHKHCLLHVDDMVVKLLYDMEDRYCFL